VFDFYVHSRATRRAGRWDAAGLVAAADYDRPVPRRRAAAPESHVLFLGAGASAAFGRPVTSELFPRIRDGVAAKSLFPIESNPKRERGKMKRLGAHLEQLLPAVFDDDLQLPLITDVLSLVDLLLTTGEPALPGFSTAQLDDLRTLLEEAVIHAIQAGGDRSDAALDRLTDWSLGLAEEGKPPLTIVSTNYDTVVESQLFAKIVLDPRAESDNAIGESVDLGFSWREHASGEYRAHVNHPPPAPRVRVLKLHGSLSWLKCPLCGFIYVNTTGDVVAQAFREGKVDYNNTCVCGHGPVRAVLVAPSMVRSVLDPNLLTIWRSALEALRLADEWVIAGYSLPPEDIAIRSILVRAFHARDRRPRIRVVQLERDSRTEDRYRLLFPEVGFEYGGFERFVESLPDPPRHFPLF
jgi:hypothetical protein